MGVDMKDFRERLMANVKEGLDDHFKEKVSVE